MFDPHIINFAEKRVDLWRDKKVLKFVAIETQGTQYGALGKL